MQEIWDKAKGVIITALVTVVIGAIGLAAKATAEQFINMTVKQRVDEIEKSVTDLQATINQLRLSNNEGKLTVQGELDSLQGKFDAFQADQMQQQQMIIHLLRGMQAQP